MKVMKIKQKLALLNVFVLALVLMSTLFFSVQAFAATEVKTCGNVETSLISCDEGDGTSGDISDTGLWGVLEMAIGILTAGVGVAALAGVVYGAVLYTTAEGSPDKVKKAIEVFRNVVIGVVAYALMYAGLNFIIPGGLFN